MTSVQHYFSFYFRKFSKEIMYFVFTMTFIDKFLNNLSQNHDEYKNLKTISHTTTILL